MCGCDGFEKCVCAAAVIKAVVTKVLAKQKWVRLLPPELSPSCDTIASCYPVPVHRMQCTLL